MGWCCCLAECKPRLRNYNSSLLVNDFVFQTVGTVVTERHNRLYSSGLQCVDLSLFKTFDITSS
jgi:hypothetical protein